MKQNLSHTTGQQHRKRGVALVITLLLLVLLSAFAVAFFSRMTVEQASATSYADGITTRQLAESAVGAVMGQIREATTVPNGAWATQPGMVRVYGGSTAANPANLSQPYGYYKLYSSDNMVVTGASTTNYNPATDVPPEGWQDEPAGWVDLNEPVRVRYSTGGGETSAMRYPILDPELAVISEGGGELGMHNSANHLVEGFSSDRPDPAGRPDVRMPVRWLYVLRDGTLTAPSSIGGDGKIASWDASGGDARRVPSKENPIVGRVAFWTDDDTSKVNINTAGGFTTRDIEKSNKFGASYDEESYPGSYWDVPRFFTLFDRGGSSEGTDPYRNDGVFRTGSLALSQPPRNEFQRYPGHPATTSLGLLFRDISTKAPKLTSEMLYTLLPRLTPGGTEGGTNRLIAQGNMSGTLGGDGDFRMDQVLSQKAERLYSSVDEFFFAAKQNGTGATATRMSSNEFVKTLDASVEQLVAPEDLEGYRFFLTAHSRAPELNLYGRPRISMWPIEAVDENKRNHTDRLLQFCSTLYAGTQKREFYFQRADPYAQTDIGIQRNQQLLQYLKTLTNRTTPGYSSSFQKKYPGTDLGDRDQILVEMFDYIRVTNLRDGTNDNEGDTRAVVDARKYAPRGVVVPSPYTGVGPKATFGFGRFPTLSEISLVLYHSGYEPLEVEGDTPPKYLHPKDKEQYGVGANFFRAFVVTETYNPMQGFAPVSSFTEGTSTGSDEQSNNFITYRMTFPAYVTVLGEASDPTELRWLGTDNKVLKSSGSAQAGRASAGMEGFAHTMYNKNWTLNDGLDGSIINSVQTTSPQYPFQTVNDIRVPVDRTTGRMPLLRITSASGGPIEGTMTIRFKNRDLQTIRFTFPPVTVPAPTDAFWWDAGGFPWKTLSDRRKPERLALGSDWASAQKHHAGWPKRLGNRIYMVQTLAPANSSTTKWTTGDGLNYGNRWKQLLQPGDTIRSVIPQPAQATDMRTVALAQPGEPELTYGIVNSLSYHDPNLRHTREVLERPTSGPMKNIADTTHTLRTGSGAVYMSGIAAESYYEGGTWLWESKQYAPTFGNLVTITPTPSNPNATYHASKSADLPAITDVNGVPTRVNGVFTRDGKPGDFDSGIGDLPDGPYGNKADEGNMRWRHREVTNGPWVYDYPYFTGYVTDSALDTFFAPNRQVPSAVAFGSLLVGRKVNWQTLCFSPNPIGAYNPGGNGTHRGKDVEPKDHLLLDLFTMPVVEPYAISEPFSTAGKINLNAQIAPFSYIRRTTALRAALHSLRLTAVPESDVLIYKTGSPTGTPLNTNYRRVLDRDETVKSIMAVFDDPAVTGTKFYKSATEICERFLYPKIVNGTSPKWSSSETAIKEFWRENTLTGDNLREKPYADLYPRVTTKSNSFTVHVRVQKLRPLRGGPNARFDEWQERDDAIASEYRGEFQVERYLDPNDRRFDPVLAKTDVIDPNNQSLEPAYRFRVVHSKRFAPDR